MLNVSPILDGWGKPKGAIATSDDVTELEHKKVALEEAMTELEKSQDEIRLQNAGRDWVTAWEDISGQVTSRQHPAWCRASLDGTAPGTFVVKLRVLSEPSINPPRP